MFPIMKKKLTAQPPPLPRMDQISTSPTDRPSNGFLKPTGRRPVPAPPVPEWRAPPKTPAPGLGRPGPSINIRESSPPVPARPDLVRNPKPPEPVAFKPMNNSSPLIGREFKTQNDRKPESPAQGEPDCLGYYHSDIRNMDEGAKVLEQHMRNPGSYLIRRSEGASGALTVSVVHGGDIKHFRLHKSGHKYTLRDVHFDKISDLIKHYAKNPVPNEEGVVDLYLTIPIDRMATRLSQQQEQEKGQSTTVPEWQQTRKDWQLDGISGQKNGQQKLNPARLGGKNPAGVYLTQPGERRMAGGTPVGRMDSEWGYEKLGSENPYYSCIREGESKLEGLIQHLYMTEPKGDVRCECGLLLEESELPRGWSFHISRDPDTYGRVFFAAPDGSTTWTLPMVISTDLEQVQKDRLLNILMASSQYVSSSHYSDIQALRFQRMSNSQSGNCPRTSSSSSYEYVDPSENLRQQGVLRKSTCNSSEASVKDESNFLNQNRLRLDANAAKKPSESSFPSSRYPTSKDTSSLSSEPEDYVDCDTYETWQAQQQSGSFDNSSENCLKNSDSDTSPTFPSNEDMKEALMKIWGNLDGGYLKFPPKDVVRRIAEGEIYDNYSAAGGCSSQVATSKFSPRTDLSPVTGRGVVTSPVNNNGNQDNAKFSPQSRAGVSKMFADRKTGTGIRDCKNDNSEYLLPSPGLQKSKTFDSGSDGPSQDSKPEISVRRRTEPNIVNPGQRPLARVKDTPHYMIMDKNLKK